MTFISRLTKADMGWICLVYFSKCSRSEAVRLLEAHGKVAEGQARYLIKLVETCCCLIMCCLQKPLLVLRFRSENGFPHLH